MMTVKTGLSWQQSQYIPEDTVDLITNTWTRFPRDLYVVFAPRCSETPASLPVVDSTSASPASITGSRNKGRSRVPTAENHTANREQNQDMSGLKIHCTHHQEGCQWIGELGDLQTHLDSESRCGYVKVECPNKCVLSPSARVSKMKRYALETHLRDFCPLRNYNCQYCGHVDTYKNITGKTSPFHPKTAKSHYEECPELLVTCPNRCWKKLWVRRKDLSAHLCPLEYVECPNKCRAMLDSHKVLKMKRKDLREHLDHDCPLRKYKCEHCQYESTYTATICENQYDNCPTCGARQLRKEMTTCTHRHKCLQCETELVQRDLALQALRKRCDRRTTCADEQRLLSIQAALHSERHHLKTCGHSFTVKIPFLSVQDGLLRKVSYSPPFYFREGYKMCLALHPNGIGKGEGTHVSLSLLLMRGEFDDQLEWPIQSSGYHLKIALLSQDKPKPKSQDGQEPLRFSTEGTTTEINVCSRCIPPISDRLKRPPSARRRVVGNRETFIEHETLTVQDNSIVLSVILMRHHCPFCTSSLR